MRNRFSVTIDKCDNETLKKLGGKIKALRTSRGISQEGLSEITHRDRSGLSGYERGVKIPTLNGLCDISNALNYNLKIQFEEKVGLNDMYGNEIFTEDFVKSFIENIKRQSTYEYIIGNSTTDGAVDEKWDIEELNEDNVILKSSQGDIIKMNKSNKTFRNKRYALLNVSHRYTKHGAEIKYKVIVDMKGVFSITGCEIMKKLIIECINIDGILEYTTRLDNGKEYIDIKEYKNGFIDTDFLTQIYNGSYLNLKRRYCLSDKDILDMIDILEIETGDSKFLDVLNSTDEGVVRVQEQFDKAVRFAMIEYAFKKYIDISMLVNVSRIADMFKLMTYLNNFIDRAYNESIVHRITIGKTGEDCIDVGWRIVEYNLKMCYLDLCNMENRNEDKDEFDVIIELVKVFYEDLDVALAWDVVQTVIDELTIEVEREYI